MLTSQVDQDVLEDRLVFQVVRKDVLHAYIKCKIDFDKIAIACKLKERDFVDVLLRQANHQGSKISFPDFHWIGHYNVEEKNFIKQQLLGTKYWNGKNANPSSHLTTTVHPNVTHTSCTDHITRRGT